MIPKKPPTRVPQCSLRLEHHKGRWGHFKDGVFYVCPKHHSMNISQLKRALDREIKRIA